MTNLLAQIITDTFDAPVQSITSLMNSPDRIVGTCVSGGNFYRFDTDGVFIEVEFLPKETREINFYAQGLVDSMGIRVDSDRPCDWLAGFTRFDAQVKCKSGGTPCGKRCLPKGQKCKISGGAGLKSPGAKLKSPVLGAIAAGVAGTALVAGTGAAAYRGRDEIKKGVEEAKGHIRNKVSEAEDFAFTRKAVAQQNLADLEEAKKQGYDMTSEEGIKKSLRGMEMFSEDEINQIANPKNVKRQINATNKATKNEEEWANASDDELKKGAMVAGRIVGAPGAAKRVVKGVGRAVKKGVTGKA